MAQIVESDFREFASADNTVKSFCDIAGTECFSIIPFAYITIFNISLSQKQAIFILAAFHLLQIIFNFISQWKRPVTGFVLCSFFIYNSSIFHDGIIRRYRPRSDSAKNQAEYMGISTY